jgi:hypothetical protein
LFKFQGVLGSFNTSLGITSGSIQLIHRVSNPAVDVFRCVRELLSSVGLIASSISQGVGVYTALMHLPPLQTYEQGGEARHNDSNPSPSQRSPFKASHFAFYLFELVLGLGLCIRSVYWLGYFGRKGHFGFLLLFGGYALAIHGGFHVVLALID